MVRLHVVTQCGSPHKGSCAVALFANQLWRSVNPPEVNLKIVFPYELFVTSVLQAFETIFFEVHFSDMLGQVLGVGKFGSALGVIALQHFLPMPC